MRESKYKWTKNPVNPKWRCSSLKNHDGKQKDKGYYEGTFFAGAPLTPKQISFIKVERGTSKCFIVPIKKRDASTLLPLIQKFCPGAVIVSDCLAAYKKIRSLPKMYEHYTVNHSENFVDPSSGQHTQTIESTWQKFKSGHKSRYGTHRSVFASYLCDFLCRRQFDGANVFFHFWSQIAELYPV